MAVWQLFPHSSTNSCKFNVFVKTHISFNIQLVPLLLIGFIRIITFEIFQTKLSSFNFEIFFFF